MSTSEKKRKATKEPSTSSTIVVDMEENTPREIATALLSMLPTNATLHQPHTKKLLQAMDLVKSEIDHRTAATVRRCEAHGAAEPFVLGNFELELPSEVMLHIFDFLARPEIVHRVSLVNKGWLAASRTPRLWTELNKSAGLNPFQRKKINMTSVLALLKRPQFALLKSLTLPGGRVSLGATSLSQLAKVCPFLEEIDVGHENANIKSTDAHISSLPALFPNLCKVGLSLCDITNAGIAKFVKAMGERLVELKIRSTGITVTDDTLRLVATVCPNLTGFAYKFQNDRRPERDRLTNAGVQALLTGCTKLQNLVLVFVQKIGWDAFAPLVTHGDIGKNLVFLEYVYDSPFVPTEGQNPIRQALEEKIKVCRWAREGVYCKVHPWECGEHDVRKTICGCH